MPYLLNFLVKFPFLALGHHDLRRCSPRMRSMKESVKQMICWFLPLDLSSYIKIRGWIWFSFSPVYGLGKPLLNGLRGSGSDRLRESFWDWGECFFNRATLKLEQVNDISILVDKHGSLEDELRDKKWWIRELETLNSTSLCMCRKGSGLHGSD